jgi:hypothetical protein
MEYSIRDKNTEITNYQYGHQKVESFRYIVDGKSALRLEVESMECKVTRDFINRSTQIKGKNFNFSFHYDGKDKTVYFENAALLDMHKYIVPNVYVIKEENHFQVIVDDMNIINIFISKGNIIYHIFDNIYTDQYSYCLVTALNHIDEYIPYKNIATYVDNGVVIYPGVFKDGIVDTKVTIFESEMHLMHNIRTSKIIKVTLTLDEPYFFNVEHDICNKKISCSFYDQDPLETSTKYTFFENDDSISKFVNKKYCVENGKFLKNEFVNFKSFVNHLTENISHYEKLAVAAC